MSQQEGESINTTMEPIDVAIEATMLPPVNTKAQLAECSEEMFNKLQDYMISEIELTLEDYKLLETMNNATVEKYQEMSEVATSVAQNVTELNNKYETMLPKLEIIEKLDKKVTQLEKMAYAIDAYSKRLEKQYKALERRANDVSQLGQSGE